VSAAATLQNLPLYLSFVATLVGLVIGFTALHVLITPFNEVRLIRAGNRAAAISLGGTVVGYALPLTVLAASTTDLAVLALWGIVALFLQLTAFVIVALLLGNVRQAMAEDKVSYGIAIGAFSVVIGLNNAGSLT
jgi:putative membrane protein